MDWFTDNFIEIFGTVAGIVYVILEVRQNIWLWPVGIITSAIYIVVFFSGKLYAEMSLQGYYVAISCFGWYWWNKGRGQGAKGEGERERRREGAKGRLQITRLTLRTGVTLAVVYVLLHSAMWLVLAAFTDSPVPGWDSFITSLSIIATWMLARKLYEHWFLWIVVNLASTILFLTRGLYPTMVLYIVYCLMSFAGLSEWKKDINGKSKGI